MSDTAPEALVGSVVDGRYEVISIAGYGGTAVVYRARDLHIDRVVALKLVTGLADLTQELRGILLEQLRREADVLATLSQHTTTIVQARDYGFHDGLPFLVLEWLEGETLDAMLDRERAEHTAPRGLERALDILAPVAEALDLAHRAGVAHRDIKPANLFVVEGERMKLLDFGVAKVVDAALAEAGAFTRTLGEYSALTPAYAAPEQFSREHGATGPWTDVFALALVLSELATGRAPLAGDDIADLAISSTGAVRPSLAPLPVSPSVTAAFARAVEVDPARRYRTAGEMWTALRDALPKPVVFVPPTRVRSRRALWIAAVVAPIAVVTMCSMTTSSARATALGARHAMPLCPSGMVVGGPFHALCTDIEPVSVRQFQACTATGACRAAGTDEPRCRATSPANAEKPVNCIDRPSAAAYCRQQGKRLSDEAVVSYFDEFRCVR